VFREPGYRRDRSEATIGVMTTPTATDPTRREVLLAAGAAATAATLGCGGEPEADRATRPAAPTGRLPVVFVPHGGGPWPFVETGIGSPDEQAALAAYLRSVAQVPTTRPKAILMISAHWEERVATVSTAERPPMLYDYYGFPPASYQLTWPAPGSPAVAARVRALLDGAGIANGEDRARGFDHGTFVPLKLAYPDADIPTVQLSLVRGLDPAHHLAIGRALAPLRDEGVFIVGSGMTFHDLRGFGNPRARPIAAAFDGWLREVGVRAGEERDRALAAWSEAPSARAAHPREEHLLPMMVVAGAAGADPGRVAYTGTILGLALSAYHYG
jgi:aromatic ring-opening dioxygenase catalytic subunit (LigB family)